ncbi:MAG: hypothetical protein ABF899_00005 [Oenococcus sp.]|uniref:hypothetical protein n=1 Tax=Oenococcus sp. TaxID=1979414 RepID=UPI0039E82AED
MELMGLLLALVGIGFYLFLMVKETKRLNQVVALAVALAGMMLMLTAGRASGSQVLFSNSAFQPSENQHVDQAIGQERNLAVDFTNLDFNHNRQHQSQLYQDAQSLNISYQKLTGHYFSTAQLTDPFAITQLSSKADKLGMIRYFIDQEVNQNWPISFTVPLTNNSRPFLT